MNQLLHTEQQYVTHAILQYVTLHVHVVTIAGSVCTKIC